MTQPEQRHLEKAREELNRVWWDSASPSKVPTKEDAIRVVAQALASAEEAGHARGLGDARTLLAAIDTLCWWYENDLNEPEELTELRLAWRKLQEMTPDWKHPDAATQAASPDETPQLKSTKLSCDSPEPECVLELEAQVASLERQNAQLTQDWLEARSARWDFLDRGRVAAEAQLAKMKGRMARLEAVAKAANELDVCIGEFEEIGQPNHSCVECIQHLHDALARLRALDEPARDGGGGA